MLMYFPWKTSENGNLVSPKYVQQKAKQRMGKWDSLTPEVREAILKQEENYMLKVERLKLQGTSEY